MVRSFDKWWELLCIECGDMMRKAIHSESQQEIPSSSLHFLVFWVCKLFVWLKCFFQSFIFSLALYVSWSESALHMFLDISCVDPINTDAAHNNP